MLLGEDDFVDKMTEHIKKHKDIPEIPCSQRFANRSSLEKMFNETMLRNNKERDCART